MTNFFASLYEFFGFNNLYSTDLGNYLRGFDETCTDFTSDQHYIKYGLIMFALIAFGYIIFYYGINSVKFNKTKHWWITAIIIVGLNFIIPFSILTNTFNGGEEYCKELNITDFDPFGFALTSSIWTLVIFLFISSIPLLRAGSSNARHTRFY